MFQHKLLFNLVKDLFKSIEGLGRSVTARVQCERKVIVDLGGIRKKYWIGCQVSRSKYRYIVFQHKLLFNLVKDLFKWFEALVRSVIAWVQSDRERIFDLGCIRKSTRYVVKFRAQKLAIVFQHNLHFNLVKEFFEWFESLGRSVIARVQCERKIIVDLGGIRKKVLNRLSNFALKISLYCFNINRFSI